MSFRGKPVMASWNVSCFSGYHHCTLISCLQEGSLRTADVSPCPSPLGDSLQGGTSATQRQKFHTDDVNQCLHNKFSSRGVPNANMFNFTFLLVDFGKVLCSFANELQQYPNAWNSSGEVYKFWLFCYRFIALVFDLCSILTYVCCLKQWIEQRYSDVQSMLMTRFWTDVMSSVWNICRWVADVPPREMSPSSNEQGETSVFIGYNLTFFQ